MGIRRLAVCLVFLPSLALADDPRPFPGKESRWEGFVRHDFPVDGAGAIVVEPKNPLPGRPWAWRGEFFGAFANADVALLQAGWHIAYIGVPNQFGSPRAMASWEKFHELLVKDHGLSPKPGLIGLSRGALYCMSWATLHPDWTLAVYLDNGVCDFKSWPGGKQKGLGESPGSPEEWSNLLKAFDFKDDKEAIAYAKNPVDHLRPPAEAKVPIMLVYGDSDRLVPHKENSELLFDRYKALGGPVERIVKAGQDHHPHGLTDPRPIVEFFEKARKASSTNTSAGTSSTSRVLGVPQLDLSGQKDRQVVVDREAGQYLGHPTTVLLEDGKTILAVYPKGHGKGAILLKRSLDGGLTWSSRLPTPESWTTSKETPTIHRAVDPSGKKRLILFSGLYPIRESFSEDDGATWSPLKPIGDFGGIVAMSSVERLKDGRYLALFHDDGRFLRNSGKASKFQVFGTTSLDGGLTWTAPELIVEHPTAHLCEPGLVRSPDGKQLAMLLRENSRKHHAFVIFSDDEGKSWTSPRELPPSLTGDRHVARYAPDGRLFVSFRDMAPDSPTKGDWVGWVGTYDDIARGKDGQYRVRLMDNHHSFDCGYPGVEVLPDGTFVATTYGHWAEGEPPYIVAVRFRLSELDPLIEKGP